jgi:hypothetical protein
MKKNRVVLVLVMVALLVGAGLLSLFADEEKKRVDGVVEEQRVEVTFPRDRRDSASRKKPVAKNAPLDTARAPLPRTGNRDPIEAAMSPPGDGDVVFIELNAIRHSPIAERIIRCREADAMRAFDDMKKTLGIDPSQDIDRLALADGVVGVSGAFSGLTLPGELGAGTSVGERGRVYEAPGTDENGVPRTVYLARVGDELLLTGQTREQVEAAALRAEGQGEVGAPMQFQGAPGELYGRFGPALLKGLLGGVDDPLAARLTSLVEDGIVRANVDEHVSVSLDITAKDAQSGTDLAQAIGGAVSAARMEAISSGNTRLAQLLEQARVMPGDDGRFDVDLAVPGEVILDALGCGPDGTPRPETANPTPSEADAPPVRAIEDEAPAAE